MGRSKGRPRLCIQCRGIKDGTERNQGFKQQYIIKITFFKGLVLYIRYNDYDEYSYQLIYSQKKLDRIRYDNYDDIWNVISKPHHFHPKGEKTAIESPMNGDPNYDVPILIKKFLINL